MSTVRDLVKGSLRLIGAIAQGETPSAPEASDALTSLNGMLDGWSTEKLIIYDETFEDLTLIPSQQLYTIGSGGNFNTTRPLRISKAFIKKTNGSDYVEYPIEIANEDEWAMIASKSVSSTYPQKLYYEQAYPLGKIRLWPVPTEANTLVLYSWKPLTAFASLDTTISIPPGYLRAIRYNLAMELAPEYGKPTSTEVMAIASESKTAIKRLNIRPFYSEVDPALLSGNKRFNIYTGE